MSILGLTRVLAPRSVAVIGASPRVTSFGHVVLRNLLEGRFPGPVMPVHPRAEAVSGVLAYPDIAALPRPPDLAVVCLPAPQVPQALAALGRLGTAGAIVPALIRAPGAEGADQRDAIAEAARAAGLRLIGPGSLGLLVPRAGLNASAAHRGALPGRLAFISQSGAPSTTVLDWARPRGIGFSCFVSLGDCLDVDFADMLDVLGNDPDTAAILLHVESLTERRAFMPAARAAARNKPLVLVKSGRSEGEGPIGPFLSEALAGPEEVFDAALHRAGALRVRTLDDLFQAVETLARGRAIKGDRLALLANGEGALALALDDMARMARGDLGAGSGAIASGEPALLAEDTRARLAALGLEGPERAAIDLGIDATPKAYAQALEVLGAAPEVDATLAIHAPTPMADSQDTARAVVTARERMGGRILSCWLGEEAAAPSRRLLTEAGLPTFPTLSAAIGGLGHLVQYRRNQDMLLETPPSDGGDLSPDRAAARALIARGLADPDGLLTDAETRDLLAAYGIPVIPSHPAATAKDAAEVAAGLGFPVALTAASPDLPRKWDVGAVALNLESAEAVTAAAAGIQDRVRAHRPSARLRGFSVQRMALRPHARQLMLGIACDPLFGPVLVFGEGGRAVEVLRDHRVALPPLNLPLARQAIARTRVARRLVAHGIRPAADLDAIALALVRLSRLLVDNPEIEACDINPLFADDAGVLAVDARVRVAPPDDSDRRRCAIFSYPADLEEAATLHDGSPITLRPIRPEDEPAHAELASRSSPQDLRYRFFGAVRELKHQQLARMTQIDYDREMAFIATRPRADDNGAETLGVVRTVTDPDNRRAELAILVRSDLKGTGLGSRLVDKIVRYHRGRGTAEVGAQVLADNGAMLALARRCGFAVTRTEDPEVLDCRLVLEDDTGPARD